MYYTMFNSLLGELILISKDNKLTGLYIVSEEININILEKMYKVELLKDDSLDIFVKTKDWLNRYFKGEVVHAKELGIEIENNILGTTFEKEVWKYIYEIPYGKVTTYKTIADKIKKKMNKENMSAQAVGRAVGKNPIAIINPCHRVVGVKGDLVGYFSGLDKKELLLNIENIHLKELFKKK